MRLELKDGKSDKFWEAELGRTWFDVTWGRIGSAGQTKRQKFPTAYEARQAYSTRVRRAGPAATRRSTSPGWRSPS